MKKYLLLAGLLPFAVVAHGQDQAEYPSARNAAAIVDAIRSKADLKAIGFDRLATDVEIDALEKLGDCEPTQQGDIEKNLALFHWSCGGSSKEGDVSLQLRFRDDGGLFTFALNPLEANFKPTEAGEQFSDWQSRKETAERFAEAVISGGDPTLDRLVPLTPLHLVYLRAFDGGKANFVRYMTKREKRVARQYLGRKAKFPEPPENAIELQFAAADSSATKGQVVTIYFDEGDRAVGVHMEEDLSRVAPLPVRGR